MLNKYIMFFKLKNNRLNKRNFNIDQNNRDYDSVHYRAALRCLYNRNNAVTSTGVVLTVAFDEDGEDGAISEKAAEELSLPGFRRDQIVFIAFTQSSKLFVRGLRSVRSPA